jgi:hypothetical protein
MQGMRITVIVSAILAMSGPAMAQTFIDQREVRQQERIGQGVQSGQLTGPETRQLERGEGRIDRAEGRALADGRLSMRERTHLNRMLNRESRQIYRDKHNAWHR